MSAENIFKQDQYLVFSLAGQDYGLDIMRVREIIEYRTLTQVPRSPFGIIGVINLRGNVVPIVDLTLILGLRPTPVTPRTCIIIVETENDAECSNVGIIVDSVSRVARFSAGEMLAAPAFAGVCAQLLRGIAKADHNFVLLLDIDRVIATPEPAISRMAPEGIHGDAQSGRESSAK